jgi:predicted DNA-binding transcriptional regulator AlpA
MARCSLVWRGRRGNRAGMTPRSVLRRLRKRGVRMEEEGRYLIRARECAKIFGIHPNTWRHWVKTDSRAPKAAIKTSRYVAYDQSSVLKYRDLRIAEGR